MTWKQTRHTKGQRSRLLCSSVDTEVVPVGGTLAELLRIIRNLEPVPWYSTALPSRASNRSNPKLKLVFPWQLQLKALLFTDRLTVWHGKPGEGRYVSLSNHWITEGEEVTGGLWQLHSEELYNVQVVFTWIHLAQDRVKWRALVSTSMNLRVS
jgi:hypothetical protein